MNYQLDKIKGSMSSRASLNLGLSFNDDRLNSTIRVRQTCIWLTHIAVLRVPASSVASSVERLVSVMNKNYGDGTQLSTAVERFALCFAEGLIAESQNRRLNAVACLGRWRIILIAAEIFRLERPRGYGPGKAE